MYNTTTMLKSSSLAHCLLTIIVAAVFATASPAADEECYQGGASWPALGQPIDGNLNCVGNCEEGSCAVSLTETAPGLIEALCSCGDGVGGGGGEEPCCHLVVTVNLVTEETSFDATGNCGDPCPGSGTFGCAPLKIWVQYEGVFYHIGTRAFCAG